MNQAVAHAGHPAPLSGWVRRTEFIRHFLGGLADNFQTSHKRAAQGSRRRRRPRTTGSRFVRSDSPLRPEYDEGNHAARRTSCASAKIRGPMNGERASVVTSSTGRPRRASSNSASATKRSYDFAPGANCTKTSTSLSAFGWPRNIDPNKASRTTPSARTSASHPARRSTVCSRSRTGVGMLTAYPECELGSNSRPRGLACPLEPRAAANDHTRQRARRLQAGVRRQPRPSPRLSRTGQLGRFSRRLTALNRASPCKGSKSGSTRYGRFGSRFSMALSIHSNARSSSPAYV